MRQLSDTPGSESLHRAELVFREQSLANASYEVEVRTRDDVLNQHRSPALSTFQKQSFHVEVR
jgi:hypothetical protein